jgi:hypothetical protein
MAGRIGGPGGKDQISSAGVDETAQVEGGAGAGTSEVQDYSGAPNAKRTVRAKSMDMSGIDLMSQLNAKLDQVEGGATTKSSPEMAELDAFLASASKGGIDGKEAKTLLSLAEKAIRNAADPEGAYAEVTDKLAGGCDMKLTADAQKVYASGQGKLESAMQEALKAKTAQTKTAPKSSTAADTPKTSGPKGTAPAGDSQKPSAAAQAKKDAQEVIAWTKDVAGVVVTEELDARIAQAKELLGSGQLDKTTEKELQKALTTLQELAEAQATAEGMTDGFALIPTPEFDAAVSKAAIGGVDEKEAKSLQALAEKMVKDAPDPSAMFRALSEKLNGVLYNAELKPGAKEIMENASTQLWVTTQNTSMARIDSAAKKLGDHLKANAATLKPPLSNIDPKSLTKADAGDSYHLSFKLKNGKVGTFESAEGKALAKLLEKDPKLASVTVGVPKAFIE